MKKINYTFDSLDNAIRIVLLNCQVFGLREAGFETRYCSKEESRKLFKKSDGTPFELGIYNFIYNDKKYSIRIAPYRDETVDKNCIWYLWSEKNYNNEDVIADSKEIFTYLKNYGVGWERYRFGEDPFDGFSLKP